MEGEEGDVVCLGFVCLFVCLFFLGGGGCLVWFGLNFCFVLYVGCRKS